MKLVAVFSLATATAAARGDRILRKITQRNGEVATSGTVKVNGNLEEINKRGGIGCQLVEINDEHLMAVNGRTLRSFTGCGRCAQISCVGQFCERDSSGMPRKITAKVVAQATTTYEDEEIEINQKAWNSLMGSKANKVSSMNIAWNYVKCPQERRAKLYVTDNNNPGYWEVQPIDVPEKITWMRIREAGKKTKFIVSKDPFKGKANYFLWGGKMSPKITLKAPLEIYLQYDSGARVRTTLQDWQVGKFAYLDGKAAPAGEKAKLIVTQSKGIMSQMGSLFGGSKPSKSAPPKTPPKVASSGGMFGSSGGSSFSSVFGSGSFGGGGFFGSNPKTTKRTTTMRPTTTPRTTPVRTTRRTTPYVRPSRPASRPKGGKGGKGGKNGGKVNCPPGKNIKRCRDLEAQKKKQHDAPSNSPIFEQHMAAPVMESPVKDRNLGATGAQFDSFIMDFLSPFLIEDPVTTPRTTTTRAPRTTKKTMIGGSSFMSFTGYGAPENPSSGVCRISPKSTIYAAISSAVGSREDCGKCVFVWCPSFSGCKGAPIGKVQIVDVYDGPGHIALSQAAFKAAIGLPSTKGNKMKTYQGTYSFTSC